MRGTRRLTWVATAACALVCALAPAAGAHQPTPVPKLDWQPCGDAQNIVCATATVPLDYDDPQGATVDLHLAKSPATDQAHRLGSLFFNFGGPGGPAADYLEAFGTDLFPAFNARYDIIAMRPSRIIHVPGSTFRWLLDTSFEFNHQPHPFTVGFVA